MKAITILISLVITCFSLHVKAQENSIVGNWESSTKDLKVKVFLINDKAYSKFIWFPCTHKVKLPMEKHLDSKNPNNELRTHSWMELFLLSGLEFEGNNKWGNGKIYNPHNGKTYSASVKMINNTQLIVRGYWGFEIFGESIIFHKIK